MSFTDDFAGVTGFDWDSGNAEKNWRNHHVSQAEAEQVFFNRALLIAPDQSHSREEPRFAALGQSTSGRRLTIIFTRRGTLLRVISARDMSRRERSLYEQQAQTP